MDSNFNDIYFIRLSDYKRQQLFLIIENFKMLTI